MHHHEQVTIHPATREAIKVDKNLKEVILSLNDYEFYTTNSCIDNFGKMWIEFERYDYSLKLMQSALTYHMNHINNRDSLYFFLQERGTFTLNFVNEVVTDPQNADNVMSTGNVEEYVSLRIDNNYFFTFKRLLLQVFPN